MQEKNYWDRVGSRAVRRRTVLKGAGVASAGVAAIALIGCGDDDDDDVQPTSAGGQPTSTAGSQPTATADTAQQPNRGGTYRWSWTGTSHLDIHQDSISGAQAIVAAVYNRLFRYEDDAQLPEPDLAVSMPEQPDDLTFVVTLQEGVKFHNKPPVNGRTLTADDVVFSLDRARTEEPSFVHRGDLASIERIEAIDDRTVRITTKYPNAVLLTTLAGYQFIILAPETVAEYGDIKRDAAAIGTGGFVLDSFAPEAGAKLSAHPEYWRTGQPYLDGLQQVPIADAWSLFLAGEVETATIPSEQQVGFDSFEAVIADAGVDAYRVSGPNPTSAQGHFMNNGAAPFDDLRVRQAINLILDREPNLRYGWPIGGLYSIALGIGHVEAGFQLPESEIASLPGYREGKRDEDIAAGLALLEQAGYTKGNPLRFEVMGWSTPNRWIGIDELQLASDMYNQASGGVIQTTVKGLEWGTWKAAEANHEFQMISSVYSMGVDPHDALQKMYGSGGGRNFAQFKDPAFDQMLIKEQGTFDVEDRKDLFKDMIRYINDQSRIANAWTGTGQFAGLMAAKVKGAPFVFDSGKVDQLWFA